MADTGVERRVVLLESHIRSAQLFSSILTLYTYIAVRQVIEVQHKSGC